MQVRRTLLRAGGALVLARSSWADKSEQNRSDTVSLLSAPIELAGDWGHMIPGASDQVLQRMRHACLDSVRLVSDRQPTRLRVDEHTSGSPAVWLHFDASSMAWVIV